MEYYIPNYKTVSPFPRPIEKCCQNNQMFADSSKTLPRLISFESAKALIQKLRFKAKSWPLFTARGKKLRLTLFDDK
jgi:hypothetical protein